MTKLKTKYGIFRAQSKINPKWIDYDKQIAKTHIDNYGVIFVDPAYETPIDDDFVLEECNKVYLETVTFKIGERVELKSGPKWGVKASLQGRYGIIVDPSIPTVKIDGGDTYALLSTKQMQKISSCPVNFSDMSVGSRYLDCSFGLVWKAVKKIPNGMRLQQIKQGGCIMDVTPDTCKIQFLLSA